MEARIFGRSGLRLSILGFGCGAVGGLMVRGSPADQDKAVGLALDAGRQLFRHRCAIWSWRFRNEPWTHPGYL